MSKENPNCTYCGAYFTTYNVSYLSGCVGKCSFTSLKSTTSLNPPLFFGSK